MRTGSGTRDALMRSILSAVADAAASITSLTNLESAFLPVIIATSASSSAASDARRIRVPRSDAMDGRSGMISCSTLDGVQCRRRESFSSRDALTLLTPLLRDILPRYPGKRILSRPLRSDILADARAKDM